MPCRTEEPTATEEYNQRTAQLAVYVLEQLSMFIPNDVSMAADAVFCSIDFTPSLCDLLKNMSRKQMTEIVYNAHSKQSRALADWWEQHQEADRRNAQRDADEKKRKELQAQALKKLTDQERAALGFARRR